MADEDKKYRVIRKSSELSIRRAGDSLQRILADAGAALFDLLVDMTEGSTYTERMDGFSRLNNMDNCQVPGDV